MKEWFIPGNVPSSKNSRRWTGRYFIASKTTMKYRDETDEYWKKYKSDFVETIAGKPQPYIIEFEFIRGTRHKFDYINPLQTVQDEMVKHGWLEDDNADILIPLVAKYTYSKTEPGVIIRYYEYDEQQRIIS